MLIHHGKVLLRPIERRDLPKIAAWFNRPEVRENLLRYWPMSIAEEEQWYEAYRKRDDTRLYAIETIADGAHIGNLGLHDLDWQHRRVTLGIMIGEPAYWDRGYGSDALRAILKHAFEQLGLNRVALEVFAGNARARRAYEKCGFVLEGRARQAVFRNGQYEDELLMSVLREDYVQVGADRAQEVFSE